jgi:predicted HTH transcriptional regulator
MYSEELLKIVARDEDSRHQFKADVTKASSLAAEMVAFSNSGGGQIFIGINNNGSIEGNMTTEDLDIEYFQSFFSKEYGESLEDQGVPLPQLLENMSLASNGELNLAAALTFC